MVLWETACNFNAIIFNFKLSHKQDATTKIASCFGIEIRSTAIFIIVQDRAGEQ